MKNVRKVWSACVESGFFLLLLLAWDALFAFFLWLMDARRFYALAGVFAMSSLLLFGAGVGYALRREGRRRQRVDDYLEGLEGGDASKLPEGLSLVEREWLQRLGGMLLEKEDALQGERRLREGYEEYVEVWVHEIKVPLSLLSFVLDNRKEEMSPLVYGRMVHAGNRIWEDVTRILYYSRLEASHRDLRFERASLRACCEEILERYGTVLAEEGIACTVNLEDAWVVTDRKGLSFILEQGLSNACKYQDGDKPERRLEISGGLAPEGDRICLFLRDNGIGVKEADLPFLFDRGFTGDTDERKRKATGMGLYLAGEMARHLNIELSVESDYGQGFALCLAFPVVEGKSDGGAKSSRRYEITFSSR